MKFIGNEINKNFNNSGCEKNWVFIDFNNSTHIVYDWNPLNICKINPETNTLDKVAVRETPYIFSRIRGSTCGFKYSNKTATNTNGNIRLDIE